MKKFIQKTVAGVSALAMTAALSATAVPACAGSGFCSVLCRW